MIGLGSDKNEEEENDKSGVPEMIVGKYGRRSGQAQIHKKGRTKR